MNILGLITHFLTPSVVGQIATMIGARPDIAEKALSAAVPGILSGMIGLAGTNQGADALTALISKQGTGGFEGLSKLMSSDPKGAATAGADVLSSMFGGGRVGVMGSKLKEYADLPEATSGSILGIAGSVIMSALGVAGTAQNGGPSGALTLLRAQKDEILGVLPRDFSKSLQSAGFIDDLVTQTKPVAESIRIATTPLAEPVRQAAEPVRQAAKAVDAGTPSAMKNPWLWPIIGGLVALGILWAIFGRGAGEVAKNTADATADTEQALTVEGVDIGSGVTSALEGITTALGSVKDAATAQAALPQLQDFAGRLSGFGPLVTKLPEAGRGQLKTLVDGALPTLRSTVDTLMGDSAIAAVLKPVVDPILTSLASLAG
ncbi:MAG: DUF937 domain-containing protein [Rhodobacterales bacterium]|nr:DUF937 domain-containing protein [Rhodobacterales bacterium]